MNTPNDGGPAFPVMDDSDGGMHRHPGMSLRDWFAGQALAGFTSQSGSCFESEIRTRTHWAWLYADGMLEARKGGVK